MTQANHLALTNLTQPDFSESVAIETVLRAMVEHAGAEYVGVQKPVPEVGITWALVMFNHPRTRSTLALKVEAGLCTETIRKHLQQSEAKFHV